MSEMNVKVLASGSKANCVYISNGQFSILVDAGIQKSKIGKALIDNGIKITDINAIFITHEHGDHVQGLSIASKYHIPVYASPGTVKELAKSEKYADIKTEPIPPTGGITFGMGTSTHMTVRSFKVYHDAMEPVGYTIETGDKKVSVLMDTGMVTRGMVKRMAYSDVYVFECNHDLDALMNGEYDEYTKKRISGDNGHLSNDIAAKALSYLIQGRGEQIYLSHMSSKNNKPKWAMKTVQHALYKKGYILGEHYFMEVV
jgi:phosphoribosyl 1,2-cyclic phosphodiesterase